MSMIYLLWAELQHLLHANAYYGLEKCHGVLYFYIFLLFTFRLQ